MIDIFSKYKSVVIGLLLGCIIGIVVYALEESKHAYRVAYSYSINQKENLSQQLLSDTFFVSNEIYIQNFTSSFMDTITEQGVKVNEFKLYHAASLTENDVQDIIDVNSNDKAAVLRFNDNGLVKYSNAIPIYTSLGLFLGLLLHLLVKLRSNR